MTDKEIIQSFLDNNQNGIREVYYAWRVPFEQSVGMRTQLASDYMDDAYQEAMIRLQQHILTGRMTQDNIQSSLLAYFKEIGYYVALEIINKRRELPVSMVMPWSDDDEDDKEILEELLDNRYPVQEDEVFDLQQHVEQQEFERIVRGIVEHVGEPCASLLIGKLWENKSMTQLAMELGYSNADSAKAQKAKCMKKVKAYVKQQLKEYGYENQY